MVSNPHTRNNFVWGLIFWAASILLNEIEAPQKLPRIIIYCLLSMLKLLAQGICIAGIFGFLSVKK